MKSLKLASALILCCFLVVEAASIGSAAYSLIQDEGSNLARRQTLNFTGAGVTCTDGSNKTTCDIPGGGGGSGYSTIQDEGVSLTQRTTLNFIGAGVTCVDDAGNTRTNCTISGGGGGGTSITTGTFASTPACSTSSYVYGVVNSPFMAYCDGSSNQSWRVYGTYLPSQPITTGGFPTTLGANATWTNSASGTLHSVFASTGGFGEINALVKNIPGGGVAWTSTTYYGQNQGRGTVGSGGGTAAGSVIYNSGNGRLETIYFLTQSGYTLFEVVRWTNLTTPISELVNRVYVTLPNAQVLAVRISFDGVDTLTYSASLDGGAEFETLTTSSVAAHLAALTDHGIMGVNSLTSVNSFADYYNFNVTTP